MDKLYFAPKDMMNDMSKLGYAMLFGSRSMAKRAAVEGFDPQVMIGSRIDDSTDWDFSAPYNEANHEALIEAGFIYWPPEGLSYKDDLTTGVYIKTYPHKFDMNNPEIFSGTPTANVVLRNDFYIFRQVWDSIDPRFYHDYIWKRSPSYDNQKMSLTKSRIRDILNQMFKTAKGMI